MGITDHIAPPGLHGPSACSGAGPPSPAERVEWVVELARRAFPERPVAGPWFAGGPDHHLACLHAAREAADADTDPADALQAQDDVAGAHDVLSAALSARWGPPETIDLTGHLERIARGAPVAAPLGWVCGEIPTLRAWRPEPGRWVGTGATPTGLAAAPRLLVLVGEGHWG